MSIAVARPAAGIILCRRRRPPITPPHTSDYEVLMVQRSKKASFFPGGWVFPGGAVDEADKFDRWQGLLNREMKIKPLFDGELSFRIAAIRELVEEGNIALTVPHHLHLHRPATISDGWFPTWCAQHGVFPAMEDLHPWARWVTPVAEKKRFDTMFYVAACREGADLHAKHDSESEAIGWFSPQEILSQFDKGQASLPPPTYIKLRELSKCLTLESVFEACKLRDLTPIRPVLTINKDQIEIYLPGDEKHDEKRGAQGYKNRLIINGASNYVWESTSLHSAKL